jgi:hypothetical protein
MRNALNIALAGLSLVLSAQAEIIDRIAVTIGNKVITESMIHQQIRLAAFVDNKAPDFSAASKRAAVEMLVSRSLLVQEMDDTRFTVPGMNEVLEYAKELFGDRFPDERAYVQEVSNRRLSDDEVRQFLQTMIRSMQFIELRFQRGQTVATEEIAAYYAKEFKQEWEKKNPGKPLPVLDDVSEEIESEILAAKTDAALEEWMKQMKATASLRFRDEVFQ